MVGAAAVAAIEQYYPDTEGIKAEMERGIARVREVLGVASAGHSIIYCAAQPCLVTMTASAHAPVPPAPFLLAPGVKTAFTHIPPPQATELLTNDIGAHAGAPRPDSVMDWVRKELPRVPYGETCMRLLQDVSVAQGGGWRHHDKEANAPVDYADGAEEDVEEHGDSSSGEASEAGMQPCR